MTAWAQTQPASGSMSASQPQPMRTSAMDRSVHLRQDWQGLTRNIASLPVWSKDGSRFHYRKSVDGGFAFVSVDATTLESRPAFDAAIIASGLTTMTGKTVDAHKLPFDRFDYTEDGKSIRFSVDYAPISCTLTSAHCAPVSNDHEGRPRGFGVVRDLRVAADNHPRLSPDGKWAALVIDDNLVIRPVGGGDAIKLSSDGSPGNFYDPESIIWSPDSRSLALYRVRPGYARMVTRVLTSPDNSVQPQVIEQLYPKPGDAVDIEQPVLFNVSTRQQINITNALFPNPYQLSDLTWRADSKSLSFTYMDRGHNLARVVSVDASTGKAHAAITEQEKNFVYFDRMFQHDVQGQGKDILWISERDGWRHLYMMDGASGRVKKQITKGAWVVRDVLRVDDEKRQIWFTASGREAGQDPYYIHAYRINYDGTGLTRLTSAPSTHQVVFSPDMSRYLDLYSRVDQPDMLELHDATTGALLRTVEKGDISRLTAAGFRAPQPYVAKARDGKTDIWGLVIRPHDFDPTKKYPVIENIYAGPHDSFVPKAFWPFGYHSGGDKVIGMQALADLGFIVVQIDGMGTANRSKAFHDVAWKNLDDSGFPDRILWMKALAQAEPAADISRVGIYGASAGGQSTLNALLFHPDFYKVGVAYAGCYDNRMDKISWNEQWLGPVVDQSYLDASGVVHADKLQGKLMLIVGEQDSNVDPASTMQVANALIKAGKDFDLIALPGEEHSVGRSTGPIDYVQRRQFQFFVDHLTAKKAGS
ncbi:MAG: S9 family peptidase [Sphingobium sp.]|nr:S9 family peptidase [Sphingobium sp.]